MVEVCIATLPGPQGPLQVAATARGLVAADWHPSPEAVLAGLRRRLGPLEVRPPTDSGPAARRLRDALPILRDLLGGRDAPAATIRLDLVDRPTFDQQVLAAVRELGWGETASYGEIARRVGAPRAARAVGGALGRNPIALVIPCHRVIASDGTLGGYGGDGWRDRAEALGRKRELLAREGVIAPMRER
jgi:methylated-DNA-[protein]-cysteine S-methyltransferase